VKVVTAKVAEMTPRLVELGPKARSERNQAGLICRFDNSPPRGNVVA
jgi:hypothetical protein